MKTLTFDDIINTNEFYHISIKNANGTQAKCRRNGKTKLWKRQPAKFQIPVKHGLYDYFYIDNNNVNEWQVI